ncbi:MAG: hypothetical protein R3A10_20160 [Caldilineaceae bacterium]
MDHLRQFYRRHAAFLIVLALFVSFRVLALFTLRTGGFVADFSDYDFYATWGQLTHMGYRTFDNLWTAYPPLFAAIMLPVYELSARVPVWIEPRLWFHLLFGLTLLVFETGNLVLIYRLGAKLDRDAGAVAPAGALALSPTPGLTAALSTRPLRPRLHAARLVRTHAALLYAAGAGPAHQPGALGLGRHGATAAALGFLVKLTPMILVPIAVRWLGANSAGAVRDEWFKRDNPGNLLRPTVYVLLFVGIIAGLGYVLVGGRTELAFSSVTINNIRPPWQSIWAVLDGFYGYGLVPLDMRNLTKLDQPLWDSRLPWTWITLAFLALYLWLYTRRYDWSKLRTPVAFAGVSTIWLFSTARVEPPVSHVGAGLPGAVAARPARRGLRRGAERHQRDRGLRLPDHAARRPLAHERDRHPAHAAADAAGGGVPGADLAAPGARRPCAGWSPPPVGSAGVDAGGNAGSNPRRPSLRNAPLRRTALPRPRVTFCGDQADDGADLILSREIDLWQELYPWLRRDYTLRVLDTYGPYGAPATTCWPHNWTNCWARTKSGGSNTRRLRPRDLFPTRRRGRGPEGHIRAVHAAARRPRGPGPIPGRGRRRRRAHPTGGCADRPGARWGGPSSGAILEGRRAGDRKLHGLHPALRRTGRWRRSRQRARHRPGADRHVAAGDADPRPVPPARTARSCARQLRAARGPVR